MSWVKRNLYFLVGSGVAVLLLGLAGYYFYSQWQSNNATLGQLNEAYGELDRLAKANPNPGNDQVNNIEIARQQEKEILSILEKERKSFAPIPPIPNPSQLPVSKEEFASALRRTIDELQRAAAAASVTLRKDYNFTFEAERALTIFAPNSLSPLSEKLGEIKAICQVLYQAKVNSLDNLRRERVSPDDQKGSASDYLDTRSETNLLAVMSPYEIAIHCFSTELAAVLSGFANSPHGFVVRAVNVEPGGQSVTGEISGSPPGAVASSPTRSGASRGSLPVLVDEKQLKVTIVLNLIKLPTKK